MVASRQTWCWEGRGEFYFGMDRQQEEREFLDLAKTSKILKHTHFLSKAIMYEPMGAVFIQRTTRTTAYKNIFFLPVPLYMYKRSCAY